LTTILLVAVAFDSALSVGLIRGGGVDMTVLGGPAAEPVVRGEVPATPAAV